MRTNSSKRETISPPHAMRGFTLIEIMIVVVIIGILAAIAFPQYQNYLMKSRRTDARSLLSQIASREEQFFADNRAYTVNLAQLNYPLDANGNVVTENGFYTIAAQQTSNFDFVLTATPVGIQAKDQCATITLDNTGKKGFTALAGTTPNDCW